MNAETGEKLRRARVAKGLSLEDLFQRTRIGVSIIEAFERGESGGLAPVYVQAFLRTLADALDMDPAALSISEAAVFNSEKPSREGGTGALSKLTRNPVPLAAACLLFIMVTVIVTLYIQRSPWLFQEAHMAPEPLWLPDSSTVATEADSSYTAVQGLLKKALPVPKKIVLPVKSTPVEPLRLRGRFTPAELVAAYPVYAERREMYLPNAVTLSRLEALRPAFDIELHFAPEDSVAQERIPPLLQIYRAAYLPETTWSFIGLSGRKGEPLVIIKKGDEELIRWSKPTDKRIETVLFDIADVIRRLNLSNSEDET